MSRFEIVIDNEDAAEADQKPWTANVFPIDEDGRSGDSIAVGFGATPQEAAQSALSDPDARWIGP